MSHRQLVRRLLPMVRKGRRQSRCRAGPSAFRGRVREEQWSRFQLGLNNLFVFRKLPRSKA